MKPNKRAKRGHESNSLAFPLERLVSFYYGLIFQLINLTTVTHELFNLYILQLHIYISKCHFFYLLILFLSFHFY